MLSALLWTPIIALLVVLALPQKLAKWAKYIALTANGIVLIIASYVFYMYSSATPDMFAEKMDWIRLSLGSFGEFHAQYYLNVDSLNVSMVFLSGIVLFVGTLASFSITKMEKAYYALFLLLSTSVIGCFISLDFLLFFLFFEFMLLPLYFLIGIWGGKRREYAAIKFFIYTLLGSVFILAVMIGLFLSVYDPVQTAINLGYAIPSLQDILAVQNLVANGMVDSSKLVHTFDVLQMQNPNNLIPGSILAPVAEGAACCGRSIREIAFLLMFAGFAIKLPVVPLHTWLPDAHVEAPTAVSVIFAGILLKVGGYGLIRMCILVFPAVTADYATWIAGLGVISILWGAYNALAMTDLKKLVAYSSVSHMGFVLLGLASFTAEGMIGSVYVMFSHGLLSSMLFILVGVIYNRTGDRNIESYKGLASKMPYMTAMTTIAFFASLGLPGFSTFIGELFVFIGGFGSPDNLVPKWMVLVAVLGIVLGAAYFLWALQRVFFGKFWVKDDSWRGTLHDLTMREYLMLVPLGVLSLLFGILPSIMLDRIGDGLTAISSTLELFIK